MRITKLRIDNYMGIKSFVVKEFGDFNLITGKNGVGKSAVLKAVREACISSGTKLQLIKIGEDEAEVHLTFDTGMTVDRKITENSNKVRVVEHDHPIKKPQLFLDELLGPHQMNPIDFMLGDKKQRRELLLQALPVTITSDFLAIECDAYGITPGLFDDLDFSQHAFEVLGKAKKIIYEARQEINRDITRIEKSVEQDKQDLPQNFNVETDTEFDAVGKAKELSDAKAEIVAQSSRLSNQNLRRNDITNQEEANKKDQRMIKQLQANIKNREGLISTYRNVIVGIAAAIDGYEAPDVQKIEVEIKNHQDNEELRQKSADIKRRLGEIESKKPEAEAYDTLYKRLDKEIPKELILSVGLPVEGLELDDDNIKLNGIELDNLSTSEQVKLSLSIAISQLGDLKVILFDRFESLDPEAKQLFVENSKGDGVEYLVTEVTAGALSLRTTCPDDDEEFKNELSQIAGR